MSKGTIQLPSAAVNMDNQKILDAYGEAQSAMCWAIVERKSEARVKKLTNICKKWERLAAAILKRRK